jgi:hypothetical protein
VPSALFPRFALLDSGAFQPRTPEKLMRTFARRSLLILALTLPPLACSESLDPTARSL